LHYSDNQALAIKDFYEKNKFFKIKDMFDGARTAVNIRTGEIYRYTDITVTGCDDELDRQELFRMHQPMHSDRKEIPSIETFSDSRIVATVDTDDIFLLRKDNGYPYDYQVRNHLPFTPSLSVDYGWSEARRIAKMVKSLPEEMQCTFVDDRMRGLSLTHRLFR
jgi:hypothetical protein